MSYRRRLKLFQALEKLETALALVEGWVDELTADAHGGKAE